MANYAIGDLQGCYEPLLRLLDKIQFDPSQDKLWFAGDLVNRGPDSLSCLKLVYELAQQGNCETVLGNHDLHMLAVYHGCAKRKKKDNFFDVIDSDEGPEMLSWLQQQALAISIDCENNNYFLSHAGLAPIWSCEQALGYAKEVEHCLQGAEATLFFENMYGNTPNGWNTDLKSFDRLRAITNYFTRMRFCNDMGELELNSKGFPSDAPEGFSPWFNINNPNLNFEQILFGHWAALEGITNKNNFFALDTGCVWGNCLSALRLEDQEVFNCPC